MKLSAKLTAFGLLAAMAAATAAPVLADPGSQQKNKNNWRNLGIAGAVVAGYGLLTHNNTATVLGAAGGAYSANRYEQDRQHQSQDSSNRQRYYRGGYNNNGYYNNNNGTNYGRTYGWNPSSNNNGYNGSYDNGRNGYAGETAYARRDNGKHKGWYKKHHKDDNEGDNQGDNRGERD